MNKRSLIVLSSLIVIIGLAYFTFLFLIPNFIDLNSFKPQIQKAAKEATGLEVDPGKLKLSTFYDLSVKLTAENPKVDKYLTLDKASVRISLLPLIFKKLEFEEIQIDKPEVFLTRYKDGKLDIEKVLEKAQAKPQQTAETKPAAKNTTSSKEPSAPAIVPVFKGMKFYVNNYRVNLIDHVGRKFVLKGDLLEVSKFKPDKYIKLATNGSLVVQNNPNINFDIKLATELPLIEEKQQKDIKEQAKTLQNVEQKPVSKTAKTTEIDIIEKILKYDPRIDLKADLKLQSGKTLPKVDGYLNFDKLSINIDGHKLPESHGKLDFSGKGADIDTKLYVTTDSYIEVAGNVKDIEKQDFDLSVKSTDIDLKDVRKFAYSLADAANANISALNDITFSGKIKADFNLKKDNYKGHLKIIDTTLSHSGISKQLSGFSSTLNFDKDKLELVDTSGKVADIGFDIAGFVDSKLNSDIKVTLPNINLATVYGILYNSNMFAEFKPQLNEIAEMKGNVKAQAIIQGQLDKVIAPEVHAVINSIRGYHKPSKTPLIVDGGNIKLDKDGKVHFKNIKTVLAGFPFVIKGEFNGDADNWQLNADTDLNKIDYLLGNNTLKLKAKGTADYLTLTDTAIYSADKQILKIDGGLDKYTDFRNFKVEIADLNLNIKELQGKASILGNLNVIGNVEAPKAFGDINLSNLEIPSLKLKTNDIEIKLKEESILVNTGLLNLDDSRIKLFAVIKNKLSPPFIVDKAVIESEFLNIDKLSQALAPQPQQVPQVTGHAAGYHEQPDLPVIINNGKFSANKLIVSNLVNQNIAFDFTLKPINMLAVRNFVTYVAGGSAIGIADMNLKTSKLRCDFTANNIEMNALATELAQMPDQVFGGMKGRIQLSTIGLTPEAMIANAIGKATFNIDNGHLGKLGDIQYLLNQYGIVRFSEEDSTNHFDKLNGNVRINKGIIEVDEIYMQGKKLSSFISGNIRMSDNHANLIVMGKLSGKIVSQLGFIKDLSVDKLINQIPGQWGQILSQARQTRQYPNRDRIPALTGEQLETDKDFSVKINGVLGQPRSVSMIEWLE